MMLDGRRAEPPQYDFAVVLRSTDALIGLCRLIMRPDELRQAEILYLLNRHYWGHGYVTEAVRAVLGFGFQELGLHRVYATCRPANVASSRVLEKVGMRQEGHLRRHRWMKGAWHDSLPGDTASAMPALARALAPGEPERLVGPFLEEGEELCALLRQAVARGIGASYAVRLLAALEGTPAPAEPTPTSADSTPRADLPEALTERETQVLRLLATHLSSTEMGEELVVSPNTVRTHIKHIYDKLDVHSRAEAVARAQALGLL